MPRFRTTAIAALAGSALLVTAGAAYAHDLAQNKLVREVPPPPSMSWANSRGYLTDLSSQTDVFDDATATAMMMSVEGTSTFRLQFRDIDDGAVGKKYSAHLHEGPCVAGDGAAALDDYNAEKEAGRSAPWAVSNRTEVHLDFEVSSSGTARTTASVPFIPKQGSRSIVIHTDEANSADGSPVRLACLPLEIHLFPG